MVIQHPTSLPDTVRAELARRHIPRAAVLEALGLTSSAFSRRMVGDVEFSVGEVQQLARLLELPVGHLLGEVSA